VIYRFGAFTLNTETFELKSGAETITAEPKVFLLLKYLIENRERVLSRDDIIDAVWDGRAVTESSLTYAIKEARRLTGDDGKTQAVIRTLPRLGFRFVAEVTESSDAEATVAKDESGAFPFEHLSPANRRWRLPVVAAALVLVAIVVGGLAWRQPWVEPTDSPPFEPPRIAVLPFQNLSGAGDETNRGGGIADALASNITTALSRIPEMFVIARTATFRYKNKFLPVSEIAEELGVRYLLEGDIQIVPGDKVRVTTKLIDAPNGEILWTGKFDRVFEDALKVQDEITFQVLDALKIELLAEMSHLLSAGGTNNLEAFLRFRSALHHFLRFTKADNEKARRLFQEAVELDPEYAQAVYMVGNTYMRSARARWGEDPARDLAKARELADKAIAIDSEAPGAYNLLAQLSLRARRYEEAIEFGEKAVAREPNSIIYNAESTDITLRGSGLSCAGAIRGGAYSVQALSHARYQGAVAADVARENVC
jgi:TolB-like protein/DNA-binding winged helix-turn-helix (wHTH) protein